MADPEQAAAELVGDGLGVGVILGVGVMLGVGVGPGVGVMLGVGVGPGVGVFVGTGVCAGEPDAVVWVFVDDGVAVPVGAGEAVRYT